MQGERWIDEVMEPLVGRLEPAHYNRVYETVGRASPQQGRDLVNAVDSALSDAIARAERAEAREVDLTEHLREILEIAHEHGGEDGGEGGVTCRACHRILALAEARGKETP